MRSWLEFVGAWLALKTLGILPRSLARAAGALITRLAFFLRPPLRRAAVFNLRLAFPDLSGADRRRILRSLVRQIGWMAGEFALFPRYTRDKIERIVVLDGFENFDAAQRLGKGVLFLTGHTSAWELAPFAQALYGYPLHFLVRPIDNPRVEALVNRYRCLSGNTPIEKNKSARAMLQILRGGGTIGILIDQNTSLEEGVFVDFFGVPACTTSGLARIALRTEATVVPGFLFWDERMRKYRLRFEPAIELQRTGDEERDIVENTARFTRAVEDYVRRHPDQWLWVHRRWKTRPPGEKPIYPF
ncbi:MAG: lysophospholipid acyltransferase family protein [Acidobacteria bacterium]|nr:lysophospholipid acyltransferase family protein [Acidobacteriota bacterium]MBI3663315.1 lysophospholipid acyltransferase family protein [Acidobacteriota bacterium]